ncbi:E3 ubiquitin-protein ligase HUWE1 isoform X3 [Aplysia californica]|uniref:HECT-type E3 ubiquitin transferase n=1 Tax=Aplysia californica TaxID=6500 RepID=A0ABM1VTY9_APLCA|nr:E3 ubiquitin-protein ligase HUWE1 isoform X3 [Aplysia californica]
MKVDRSKLKKPSSEVPAECKVLIDKLRGLSEDDLCRELGEIKVWTFGKCELYHWADILDIFDAILEKSCAKENEKKWTLHCDLPSNVQLKRLLLEILRFTALLIEHSFSRHLYNSMDHLTTLLTSCDMSTVLYVLNLLYVFSKRSNFISRMNPEKKQGLIQRLVHLAESWGGKENGFGLAECCQDLPSGSFPSSATTLHFEFYSESKEDKGSKKVSPGTSNVIQSIHMENVDKTGRMPSQIMEDIADLYEVPQEKRVLLFTHIRLACLFSDYEARVHCVQARLQAISILVYSSAIQENMNVILYPGLIEELVDIVEIKDTALVDIKSAALRTLTSVIHIERNPRLNSIIDATGASSYHGFLPVLVRTCIQHMIDPELKPFPQTYATSLFSFLYHLASYESGVEALVSCGMMESLLKVINWYGDGQEHITFVTRAVRVIDLITNMDMAAFQALGGLQAFINRLEHEVNICRVEQPYVHRPGNQADTSVDGNPDSPSVTPMDVSMEQSQPEVEAEAIDGLDAEPVDAPVLEIPVPCGSSQSLAAGGYKSQADDAVMGVKKNLHCFAQRAALLKSMLNFMKKAIPDLSFADSIRHLMDGSLPTSLKHIISNAEYYGPSLFLLATDVVTVYVFQEPSLLSSLQDKGLTDVVLHALLIKDVPATREVLASLPNVFSALCLNARGLEAFVACKPFDRVFKVLLSPDYLPAMRRRRSSEPFGDTASNLGNAMDELMRHQPSLRTGATKAIVKLLEEICSMGQNSQFICQKQQPKSDAASAQVTNVRSPQSNEASSSDEEEDEEVEMPHMPRSITASAHITSQGNKPAAPAAQSEPLNQERQAIPLMDYVLNVMKFVEAILSNNSTDDHCREFVAHNGLKPLMSILGLPNLPIDFPTTPACQAVSSVCKSILTLSREPQVMRQGLLQMNEVLQQLEPLHRAPEPPGGSVLLHELAQCGSSPDATLSPSATPLLHALAAAHAYIMMFVHVCRMGQADIRTISVNNWGSDLGLSVLKGLSSLYNSLVWESTVLLALCNEDYLPADCPFGRADLEKLLSKDAKEKSEAGEGECSADSKMTSTTPATADGRPAETGQPQQQSAGTSGLPRGSGETGSNGVSVAMETLTTGEEGMDTSEPAAAAAPGAVGSSAADQPHQPGTASGSEGAAARSLNLPAEVSSSTSSTSLELDMLPGPAGLSEDKDAAKRKVSLAMQAQLRQLKPLLTLSSRLGRALSELFVLLVKLCVGSPVRQRRSQQPPPTPPVPSPAARAVALALTKLLSGGLSFQPPPCAPQPKLRMTFLVCSAGFTAPLLFDEKKQPYHLMLQKFVSCGGQASLFQAFSWALSIDGKVPLSEGLEHPDLPEGTGEFLDSWLALVEKMINPKAVLESPHTLPPKNKAPGLTVFNPVQYLISTQKAAFNAVMNLWNKKPLPAYGSRMSESVLAILCHIILGESILQKHLEREKSALASGSGDTAVDLSGAGPSSQSAPGPSAGGPSAGPSGASVAATSRRPLEPLVNQQHLQQLMDMGFTREQATVALNNTSSLEQATDYILSNPIPPAASAVPGSMDLDMNDEDQMMRAIAMSLGENAVLSTDQAKNDGKEEKQEEETEEKQEDEDPLDSSVLDEFTRNIFPGCLNLLDTLPETVYRVCDLLIVVMQRNGNSWRRSTLASLCEDLCTLSEEMMVQAQELNLVGMHSSPSAQKFAIRLHLLCLLAEEMNLACALSMDRVKLPSRLVQLLSVSKDALLCAPPPPPAGATPKWLAHMLLLLDLWEKLSVSLKRKMQARITVGTNSVWKWFDDSSGRWCKYSTNNNTTIDEAFKKGESFVRFQAGRRKYSVQFGSMIQLNEETGNRRPVMLSIPTAEEKSAAGKQSAKETTSDEQLSEEVRKEFEAPTNLDEYLPSLPHESIEIIISCLSSCLSISLDPDTLHAAMRLILRVTRHHQYAVKFVAEGGARRLLALSVSSNFQGFLNLATLIFRHILEEPVSLRYCMEKVMRNVCAGIGSCQSGVSQGGVGAKEMHYVLRVLGPAACRDPEMFVQVARHTLQITLPPASLRDDDEARYVGPNAPQILKCTPTKQLESLVNPSIKTFIWDLLNALIVHQVNKPSEDSGTTSTENKEPQTLGEHIDRMIALARGPTTTTTTSSTVSTNGPSAGAGAPAASTQQTPAQAGQQTGDKPPGTAPGEESTSPAVTAATTSSNPASLPPLIPKSAILRLLSEMIRSYGNCVQLITQYTYPPGQTELVPDGCSVLAFVLDCLLPNSQEVGDKDCPALARVFVASIASCSHSPDAQMALVTEVKGALQRALALPESSSKHQRIQALSSIINTMIESCPTPGQLPNQVFKGQQVMNNNMMKILVKKGVLVDLARIPHSLELSSPFLANTINAALKPLETLSRSVNSPDKFVSMKKSGADHSQAAPDQGGTTTQVVTEPAAVADVENRVANLVSASGEMNVTIEDVTNDPEAQANLEVTSDHRIMEPQVVGRAQELNEVLSELLNSHEGGNPEDQVISEMTISQARGVAEEENEILIDVEVEADEEDFEPHDSQMVSQVLSDEEDEGEDRDHDRDHDDNQDDVSADEEDYDEADQEEMGDDDEEEEDDDEDEEDDEGSDVDGELDDFQEQMEQIRNPFETDDLVFNVEDFNNRVPSLPPAPSNITSMHPLLMRQSDQHSGRAHRGGRQRLRTLPVHVNLNPGTRQPNTPVILQRLLGPSTAAEILQLTSTLSGQNTGDAGATRVVLPIIQRPEEDLLEELFADPYADASSSGTGALSCIPSTLTRWTEETKVLDGDGVHVLVLMLKPPLVEELVRRRDEELAERKEKRKKNAETEDERKEKQDASGTKPTSTSSGANATVSVTSSQANGAEVSGPPHQAAEMLASAMVEQVLSPMAVSSSDNNQGATPVSTTEANALDTSPAPAASMDLSFGSGEGLSSSSSTDLSPLYAPALHVINASTPSSQPTTTSTSLQATVSQMVSSITQLMQQQQDRSVTSTTVTSTATATTVAASSSSSNNPASASLLFSADSAPAGGHGSNSAAAAVSSAPFYTSQLPLFTTLSMPTESSSSQFSGPAPQAMEQPSITAPPQPESWGSSLMAAAAARPEQQQRLEEQRSSGRTHGRSMISELLDSLMSDQSLPAANTPVSSSSTQPSLHPASSFRIRHLAYNSGNRTAPHPPFFMPTPDGEEGSSQETSSQQTEDSSLSVATRRELGFSEEDSSLLVPVEAGSGPYEGLYLPSIMPQASQSSSSSGATGATPPLSNLGFVSSTAPSTMAVGSEVRAQSAAVASATISSTASAPPTTATGSTDPELPEGVDPSFLAALPEHIRQEVISEQLRLQRIRRRAQEQAQAQESTPSGNSAAMQVNPEFLAALPPAIQEEVLAQQRAEQARMAAQQQSASNPDLPVDPATFFSTLPTSLRQQVLSDMDDSMLAVLPPELAAEAQELRRDMEERHRRLLQERLIAQGGAASISAILRHSGLAGRLGTRYAIRATQRPWSFGGSRLQQVQGGSGTSNPTKVKGRFMLDPEALSCLLVLLFLDEPKLNTARLHRVLRNLCYHGPTRAWLIRALLSIVQKAGDVNTAAGVANALCVEERLAPSPAASFKDKGKGKKSAGATANSSSSSTSFSSSSSSGTDASLSMQQDPSSISLSAGPGGMTARGLAATSSTMVAGAGGYWLSISLEAALGCRANVFQIHRSSGKKSSGSTSASVSIHPQAAPVVCRHALDTLISLAKMFPTYFLPAGKAKEVLIRSEAGKDEDSDSSGSKKLPGSGAQSSPKMARAAESASGSSGSARHEVKSDNDFWNILVRLDGASGKSKGKSVQRSHSTAGAESELQATDYASSALGQLMSMLSQPVVRRSQLLTDRLLRLLGLISVSLPDTAKPPSAATTTTTTTTTTASSTAAITTATDAVTTTRPAATSTTTTTAAVAGPVTTVSATAAMAVTSATATTVPAAPNPTVSGEATEQQSVLGATTDASSTEDGTKKKENGSSAEEEAEEEEESPILYNELKLAVEVLTSKSCSEEGLEDATNLLLQLSWANSATRAAVLELLLSGARQLGMTVCGHINSLLVQLQELNAGLDHMEEESSSRDGETGGASAAGSQHTAKGILPDRFSAGSSVVVSAPSKLKTGKELQLSSMSQLTSKSSGQQFFLRILKVIIQLRDAARSAGAKNKKPASRGGSGLQDLRSIINSVVSDNQFLNMIEGRAVSGLSGVAANNVPGSQAVAAAAGGQASSGSNLVGSARVELSEGSAQPQSSSSQSEQRQGSETPMEVDASLSAADREDSGAPAPGGSSSSMTSSATTTTTTTLPRLSEQLCLEELWSTLGACLSELAKTPDHHAVLILQPAVEAFFIVHAGEKVNKPSEQPVSRREDQLAHLYMEMAPPSPSPGPSTAPEGPISMVTRDNSGIAMASITHLPPDTQKFLKFAETHRTVLNQILRQSTFPLAEGPFSVLVDYTRILDFDVKRRYFRQELERMNEGARREDLPVHVRRSNVFEDSFRELFRRSPEEWKQRFYIVFEGEEGQDAGGLLREWYIIISHEIFNQNYALFLTSPGDRVTYSINPSSHCNSNHLSYFKFVGRIIAKAVYDNKLLDCYFTRSFYKHMLGLAVKYMDMESEDYTFYQGMVFLLENSVEDLGYDIFFSTEIQEFGVTETRELVPNGSNLVVTDDNKREYVKLVCQMKMTGAIRQQLNAFLEGFYDIIPKKLVSIFTEQELELLISGLPTIDIDNLKANTEYHKYQATSLQIQWFWRALRSFDQAERANFLQFVTGTSKVPLGGFGNLEGMNGTQKFQIHRDDRSTDRLPSAHTCFNQLDLPAYETYDKLRKMLLLAISECSEGFGLA